MHAICFLQMPATGVGMGIPGFGGAGGGGAGGFMSNLSPINLMTGGSAKLCKPPSMFVAFLPSQQQHLAQQHQVGKQNAKPGRQEIVFARSNRAVQTAEGLLQQNSTKAGGTWFKLQQCM
jgi:hypothetical protein